MNQELTGNYQVDRKGLKKLFKGMLVGINYGAKGPYKVVEVADRDETE